MNGPAKSLGTNDCDSTIVDIAAMEFILLGDLRDVLEEPLDGITLNWLRAVVDALLDVLQRLFALMDDGGYLQEVLDCDPNWAGYVERLAAERREIFSQLKILRGELVSPGDRPPHIAVLRDSLKDWMTTLIAFHRHERRLLQMAFNLDVGIGD